LSARQPRLPRLYEQLAAKLVDAIVAGEYGIGDRLPAERELAVVHGVSRTTVREAFVALEVTGVVEVRVGSGVYVVAMPSAGDIPVNMDVGPFELTEARMLFEGEVAALAATLATDEELAAMERLLREMERANQQGNGEEIDRQFHLAIARATRNSAMASVVESLWTIRLRSPQCVRLFRKSRARGTKPVVAEHRAIFNALRARNPIAARNAMQQHLRSVIEYLLDATESEALAGAKAHASAQRTRFGASRRLARG